MTTVVSDKDEVLRKLRIEELNTHQQNVLDDNFMEMTNYLCIIPTGSGKSIIYQIRFHQTARTGGRCLYINPNRITIDQQLRNLKKMDFNVKKVVGGMKYNWSRKVIKSSDIICMTPEKLYYMLLKDILLIEEFDEVVFDEIHMIGDQSRGHIYHCLVGVFRFFQINDMFDGRILGLSGTYDNHQKLAQWLNAKVYYSTDRNNPLNFYTVSIQEDGTWNTETEKYNIHGYDIIASDKSEETFRYRFDDNIDIDWIVLAALPPIRMGMKTIIACQTVDEVNSLYGEIINKKDQLRMENMNIIKHTAKLTVDERDSLEVLLQLDLFDVLVCTTTIISGYDCSAEAVVLTFHNYHDLIEEISKEHEELEKNDQIFPYSQQIVGRVGHKQDLDAQVFIYSKEERKIPTILEQVTGRAIIEPVLSNYLGLHRLFEIGIEISKLRIVSSIEDYRQWIQFMTVICDNKGVIERYVNSCDTIHFIDGANTSLFCSCIQDKRTRNGFIFLNFVKLLVSIEVEIEEHHVLEAIVSSDHALIMRAYKVIDRKLKYFDNDKIYTYKYNYVKYILKEFLQLSKMKYWSVGNKETKRLIIRQLERKVRMYLRLMKCKCMRNKFRTNTADKRKKQYLQIDKVVEYLEEIVTRLSKLL